MERPRVRPPATTEAEAAARKAMLLDATGVTRSTSIGERLRAVRAERIARHNAVVDGDASPVVYAALDAAQGVLQTDRDGTSDEAKDYTITLVLDKLGAAERDGAEVDPAEIGAAAGREVREALTARREPAWTKLLAGKAPEPRLVAPVRLAEVPEPVQVDLDAIAERFHAAGDHRATSRVDTWPFAESLERMQSALIESNERIRLELVESNGARARAEFDEALTRRAERRWKIAALVLAAPSALYSLDKLGVF